MQVNQSAQTDQQSASASDSAKQRQSSQKISEDAASKFNQELLRKDELSKQKQKKELESDKKDKQSLASLFAEQRSQSKDSLDNDSGGDQQSGERLVDMAFARMNESRVKTDIQVAEMQQVKSVKEVEAVLQKMADQIHVSGKDAIDGAEIRVSIKDSILPGTEVKVHRHSGEITVTVNTSSAEAHNLLAQHQASLQKHLSDRFSNENVQINFHMTEEGGEQKDGRSKNEYISEDNENSNDDKPV
ncbi:MAG: type III secretion HpaP family protein [Candidatus Endonucleobacter sp. (ex Gigantidas childressi)]|nr:type III secretion HpaP family protein [Candidatus Endonucleobacter sp. (ex Gigantidas childressi)]